MTKSEKPDEEHLAWAIEQRTDVQRTLLELYKFVRNNSPDDLEFDTRYLLEHLIGTAFSLGNAPVDVGK